MSTATNLNNTVKQPLGVEHSIDDAVKLLQWLDQMKEQANDASSSKGLAGDALIQAVKDADQLGTNPASFFSKVWEEMHYNTKLFDEVSQKTIVVDRSNGKAPAVMSTYRSTIVKAWDNNNRTMKGITSYTEARKLANPKEDWQEALSLALTETRKAILKASKKDKAWATAAIAELHKIKATMNQA